MSRMEQVDHIEQLKRRSVEREKKAVRIQEQYRLYLKEKGEASPSDKPKIYRNSKEEFALEDLLLLLDEYCIPWVRTQLWKTRCYSDEIEDIALQDARMAIALIVRNTSGPDQARDHFAYYAFGIYKNKTLDAIRKELRHQKRTPTVSTEEVIGENGKKIEDILPSVPFDYGEKEEQRKVYDGVFRIYCTALLTSKAFPPRCIALCYADVLPHLLGTIPESKAKSAKWAYIRMGTQSMDELKSESEDTLQCRLGSSLAWGAEFVRQLNDELTISDRKYRLGDVIYTEVYDKGKIEDWAESMHKSTVKAAIILLAENKELSELAKEYSTDNDVLSHFIRRKGDKSR